MGGRGLSRVGGPRQLVLKFPIKGGSEDRANRANRAGLFSGTNDPGQLRWGGDVGLCAVSRRLKRATELLEQIANQSCEVIPQRSPAGRVVDDERLCLST